MNLKKRPSNVRWLSVYEASDAAYVSWSVLVMTHDLEVKNKLMKPEGFSRKLTVIKFFRHVKCYVLYCVISKLVD